jgi:hypothetical protein
MTSFKKEFNDRIEWWLNGNLHHKDGPAIEYTNGHKEWWQNGKLHRKSGHAVEWSNGNKEWWVNGKRTSFHIYNLTKIYNQYDQEIIYVRIR